jgi:hypothetical protein
MDILLRDRWSEYIETNITTATKMAELLNCVEVINMKKFVTKFVVRWDLLVDSIIAWITKYLEKKQPYSTVINDYAIFVFLVDLITPIDSTKLENLQALSRSFTVKMVVATAELYIAIQTELPQTTRPEYCEKVTKFAALIRKLPVSRYKGVELKQMFAKLRSFNPTRRDNSCLNKILNTHHLL